MILVVDMNSKPDSLSYNEFVSPVTSVAENFEACEVKHFTEVDPTRLNGYSKIILCGTTLKDNETLRQPEKFSWIKKCTQPVLGICAGIQTICLVYGETLSRCLQVGMTEITTTKENPLFEGTFNAYALHNFSVEAPSAFEVLARSQNCVESLKHKEKPIYGVMFHPEVRNLEILQRFLKLT
ncbi:MAG: gamma-glutamyl-gamma-aminobutyrate hydrolase family protein [Candidatus Bathyarchaeota archaeon]|nr:gamma-glutamyl-gamma-aminobutyrate hydrolase family protein [Candidatus Bathyarchaeota archaeon]